MLSQRLANIVFAVLLLGASGWFAWIAQGFEAAGLLAASGLPSRFFPQLLLGGMALCAIIVLGTLLLKTGDGPKDASRDAPGDGQGENEPQTLYESATAARRGLTTLGAVICAFLIWQHWGFELMAVFLGRPLSWQWASATRPSTPWFWLWPEGSI